jgi:hypothetical protein
MAEPHPVLCKYSERREQCKELAQFALPGRILYYVNIVKGESFLIIFSRINCFKNAETHTFATWKRKRQFDKWIN